MKTILVVDPDLLIRRMVFNSLSSSEFRVIDAGLPGEAFSHLQDDPADLIFLDAGMIRATPSLILDLKREAPEARMALLVSHGEETRPADQGLVQDVLEKPFSPMGLVKMAHRLLGDSDWVETRPLHDVERQQLLLYARDLARLRREDERKTNQLKATHHRLQEFEKMKDMFLALVSHELRTPLTIIKGNVHLLRRMLRGAEAGSKEEKLTNFVEGVSAGSERLEGLVTDLMSYSSVRCGVAPFELRPLDLRGLLRTVLHEFEQLADTKSVQFQFDHSRHEVTLMGDSGRLKEAFAHVIKNAILYNVPQGSVVVRCHGTPEEVVVSIIDSGPGISPAERDKVFTPFYQAHDVLTRRVEGIGLGLAITRHIVESHGGQIRMTGELGKGTEVRVSLPLAPPEMPQLEFAPRPPEEFEQQMLANPAQQENALSEYSRELYAAYDRERSRRRLLEDQYRDMENTFLETLAALMRQIDIRNKQQESHVDKVMLYASEIARRIEPDLQFNKDFQLSLLLHDIGKIGVAESLLQKAGRLTDAEQQTLRVHTSFGADFLASIEYLQPALVGVRHQRERWDGKGYPDGLIGNRIPLWSRIISVADSFDAMVSERPYRKALSVEDARREIEKNSGSQFDPEVVKAFVDSWEMISAVATGDTRAAIS